ncbi:branched-chain amino acid aminotransferase [Solitalea lacus]|uniref:branched-chain amino acid aminotransferase n=1 Tax=Solitalea lacus TaxID=2911172 RepID=UPI001EDC3E6C|nr:branched-chain amino acid aminotransferase [Solitalea lacus]UKJ08041.1 branched-chain amino acid aminotransferase [Solitalea lacus]
MLETLNIDVQKIEQSKISSVDFNDLPFGKVFADHMFVAEYSDGEWKNLAIKPYAPIEFTPAMAALHYGQAIFEGLKAFKNEQGQAVIFRPEANFQRFNLSAERMCMPTVPEEIFMKGMAQLIDIDQNWIPNKPDSALYIRPFMFSTDEFIGVRPSSKYLFIIFTCPVGAYYSKPVKVKFETTYSRSCPGGIGYSKAAANYGGAMYPTMLAQKEGFDQVIWTDSSNHEFIEESGVMNVMFVIDGKLITPPAKDTILKGITRDSVLTVARDWGMTVEERPVAVSEVVNAIEEGRLTEAFGVGTAATISQIAQITNGSKDYVLPDPAGREFSNKVHKHLDAIKAGTVTDTHGWIYKV